VTTWIENSISKIQFGQIVVTFTIHEGKIQYIDKDSKERCKP